MPPPPLSYLRYSLPCLICSSCGKPSSATFLNFLCFQSVLSLLYVNLACFQINLAGLFIFPVLSQKPWFTLLIFSKPSFVPGLTFSTCVTCIYCMSVTFIYDVSKCLYSLLKLCLSLWLCLKIFSSFQSVLKNVLEFNCWWSVGSHRLAHLFVQSWFVFCSLIPVFI